MMTGYAPDCRPCAPAAGKPCWLVQHGYGSFVTMEFGEPHVKIGGPILMHVHI
jgi:hypothetical protein